MSLLYKIENWWSYIISWISDGLGDLTSYTKDIIKGLRELKRSCPLATKMLKVLVEENESKAVSLLNSFTIV